MEERKLINGLKCMAIISVICAHVCEVPKEFSVASQVVSHFLEILSKGGVGAFFVIAGYLFAYNKRSWKEFIKNKAFTIVLPWICTGTMVYLYTKIQDGGMNVKEYVLWLLGVRTYLWYLMVLTLLWLLFLNMVKVPVLFNLIPIISVFSFLVNKMVYPYLWSWGGDYLNIFNWMFFFWLGISVNKAGKLEVIWKRCTKYRINIIIAYFTFVILLMLQKGSFNYRQPIYILYVIVFSLFSISAYSYFEREILIQKIGEISFSIYLVHMPFAGITSAVCNLIDFPILIGIRPIIVLVLTMLSIYIYKSLCEWLKWGKIGRGLLGLR